MERIETTPEELFILIGEREFIKFKQQQEIQRLYAQVGEMAAEITKLREKVEATNGK